MSDRDRVLARKRKEKMIREKANAGKTTTSEAKGILIYFYGC